MFNCTPNRDRWKILTLALHCCALASRLFDLRHERGIDKTPAGDQYRMFQLTTEDRADFTKFAKNIRWLITDHAVDEKFWGGYSDYDYTDWEFRTLFDPLGREKTEAVVVLLEKVGSGEELTEDEMKTVREFLLLLNGRALARTDHGGCF